MPTYEYACSKCSHTFEAFQSMKDEPLKKCPECKKSGLKRLVGRGAGLIFKGSGFYITDYKKSTGAEKTGAEKAGGEKTGGEKSGGRSAAETKSESKPSESKSTAPATSTKPSATASKSP